MKTRWPHLLFSLIWLLTACVFLGLAFDAHKLGKLALPRTEMRMPTDTEILVGKTSYNRVINHALDVTDESAKRLEKAIHHSAHTLLWLNIVSAFAASLGFAAQIIEHMHERRQKCAANQPTC